MRARLLSSQNEKIKYTLESQQGIGDDTPAISLRENIAPSHGKSIHGRMRMKRVYKSDSLKSRL
jgi:hypothetical protein